MDVIVFFSQIIETISPKDISKFQKHSERQKAARTLSTFYAKVSDLSMDKLDLQLNLSHEFHTSLRLVGVSGLYIVFIAHLRSLVVVGHCFSFVEASASAWPVVPLVVVVASLFIVASIATSASAALISTSLIIVLLGSVTAIIVCLNLEGYLTKVFS